MTKFPSFRLPGHVPGFETGHEAPVQETALGISRVIAAGTALILQARVEGKNEGRSPAGKTDN